MYNNEVIKEESWFKRNWKWVVPTGGCLTLIIIGALVIGTLVYKVSNVIGDFNYQEQALEKVNLHEKAIELLGSPIKKSGPLDQQFKIDSNGEGTSLEIEFNVSGSKKEGVLYIDAKIDDEETIYNQLYIIINDTEEKIDLLFEN